MPATDPVKALLEALADREGYRLEPKEADKRTEPTEMDRLSEALKRMTSQQLVRVIRRLTDHRNALLRWIQLIDDEYRRLAAEITVVTLPGVRGNTWDPPRLRGLVEEIGFVDSALRLAEEALADRILREAAGRVLNLSPDDDHASYLVIDSLVDLVTQVAAEVSADVAA